MIAVAIIFFFALSKGGNYSGTVTYNGNAVENVSVSDGRNHSFMQISDTEIGEGGVGEWINFIKNTVDENKPAFIIHTGDICYEAGLKRHKSDMNTENMGVPVRYVIGNHDYVDGKYGEELFESIYGPVWYSFEVGNVHYIVTPFQTGADYKSGYNKNDRWRWLENDLANTSDDMKIIMFNHTKSPSDDYVISFDRKALDLKEHNLTAWVYGHYHDSCIKDNNGVLDICTARPDCGGIDSSVSGARMIYVSKDGKVTSRMSYYDLDLKTVQNVDSAKWSTKIEGNTLFCNTVLDDSRVYVATNDENYPISCGVTCLDYESGNVVWFYQTENSVKNNVKLSSGTLVAQDCEGNVYCLDAENGEELWTVKLGFAYAISTSSGICIDNDMIYAGTPDSVYALNINDGSVVWEKIRKHGEPSPAEFVVAGDKLIVSSHWDALVALDKNTGKELWKNMDEDILFRSSTPVQIDDNTLLVADSDAIMFVDLSSGEITTKKNYDDKYNFSSSAQPYIKDNKAFIPTAKNGLIIFDLDSKEIVKQVEVGKALIYTAPYTNTDAQNILLDNDKCCTAEKPDVTSTVNNSYVEIKLKDKVSFNTAVIEEVGNQAQYFRLQAKIDNEWITIYQSEKIQSLRICSFNSITTDSIRLSVDKFRSDNTPVKIKSIKLYNEVNHAVYNFEVTALADGTWGDEHNGVNAYMALNWESVVNQIVDFVNKYDFDGVDIDWEYPQSADDWANYDKFMQKLSADLKKTNPDSIISTAFSSGQLGLSQATYDCIDQIQFMAYDGNDDDGYQSSLQ